LLAAAPGDFFREKEEKKGVKVVSRGKSNDESGWEGGKNRGQNVSSLLRENPRSQRELLADAGTQEYIRYVCSGEHGQEEKEGTALYCLGRRRKTSRQKRRKEGIHNA